jgi:hypothetical protein
MKLSKSITIIPCLLLSVCILFSCNKSNSSSSPSYVPTTDDAANIAASTMQSGSGGFADQAGDAASLSGANGYGAINPGGNGHEELMGGIDGGPLGGGGLGGRLICGVPYDTSYTVSYTGNLDTASVTHQWSLTLDCTDSTLTFAGSFMGSFEGPNVKGSRTGNRNWVLNGFGSDSIYTINGTFNCAGDWVIDNTKTVDNTVQIVGTNVTVSKLTHRITGGTGTITITSAVSNGNTYTFTGTITFNGSQHLAVIIINGKTYYIFI